MAGETNPYGNDVTPEASEKTKRQWKLNSLILVGVLLLGAVLPPEYKAYAPLLFVVPFIISVANKMRQAGENSGDPSQNPNYAPHEPYTYKPKDPKDPRKYKPLG
ncbi:MAG: hypothetical protein JXR49_19175 [Acidobacteria bacterium]|nr:hypothetical protein [Acidobacteriota bacterium]